MHKESLRNEIDGNCAFSKREGDIASSMRWEHVCTSTVTFSEMWSRSLCGPSALYRCALQPSCCQSVRSVRVKCIKMAASWSYIWQGLNALQCRTLITINSKPGGWYFHVRRNFSTWKLKPGRHSSLLGWRLKNSELAAQRRPRSTSHPPQKAKQQAGRWRWQELSGEWRGPLTFWFTTQCALWF